jgi:hypothetical protein
MSFPAPNSNADHAVQTYFDLLAAAFCAFNAFLRLLRIMTTLRKLPTTAPPRRIRMTGIRMAHTRGGKRL